MAMKWLLYVKKEKTEYKKRNKQDQKTSSQGKIILLFIILFLG
jgi:hypothetical protein